MEEEGGKYRNLKNVLYFIFSEFSILTKKLVVVLVLTVIKNIYIQRFHLLIDGAQKVSVYQFIFYN